MSAARDFNGDYSPGGLSGRALRRARARRAGIASGAARRKLSRGKREPRMRSRDHALALAYTHRQLDRKRFDELFEREWPRPVHGPAASAWERGRETLWQHYIGIFRLYRARGQHSRTTNAQRGAALAGRGRPRCRRQVQRLHRRLEQMGVALLGHYKDQGPVPGHRDCLVLEIRTPCFQHVTPPAGAGASSFAGGAPALPANVNTPDSAGCAGKVPPDGGDQRQAPSAPVTEEERAEAMGFDELHDRVFGPPTTALLVQRQRRRPNCEPGPPRSSARD